MHCLLSVDKTLKNWHIGERECELTSSTVKPRLSGLVGTRLNSPDNRESELIENVNIYEPDDLMPGN